MKQIDTQKAIELVRSTKGGFFRVNFVKKDGSQRSMLCRTGVRHVVALKGKPSTVDRPDTPYVTVWDVVKHAYRVINLATLSLIRFNGEDYVVTDKYFRGVSA